MGSSAEHAQSERDAIDWRAHYRIDPTTTWSECRVLDLTLDGARVELADDLPTAVCAGDAFSLHIDSIADDDVGIDVPAVVTAIADDSTGRPVVDVDFSARREERMLLHLLVRLHALV